MILTASYYYFQSVIPPEICNQIIKLGLEKIEKNKKEGKSVDAVTFNDTHKQLVEGGVSAGGLTKDELRKNNIDNFYERDSKVVWFDDKWLYDLIYPYIHEANKQAGWNWDWDHSELFQFTVYEEGGLYNWHSDGPSDHQGKFKRYIYGVTPEPLKADGRLPRGYVSDDSMVGKVRKISLTINLNDSSEYEGGELKFDYGVHAGSERIVTCDKIKPQGSIVIFPSFLPHCVTPVTKGTRYSLVLWTLGKPFK